MNEVEVKVLQLQVLQCGLTSREDIVTIEICTPISDGKIRSSFYLQETVTSILLVKLPVSITSLTTALK